MRILLICLALVTGAAQAADVEVRVEGVDGELRENILLLLSLVRYRDLPDLKEPMVRRLHARAPDEIRTALQPFGYYEPVVTTELEEVNGGWRARYSVEVGEPVRIGDIDLVVEGPGADLPAFVEVQSDPGLRRNTPLRHTEYELLKRRFRLAAAETGFLDARFALAELQVSVEARTADIVLHYETGPRYRFGPITLEQDILDDDFLMRYIHVDEGAPFSQMDLLTIQYALSDSEYFSVVEIDARREDAVDLAVPVTVKLLPRPKHRYTAGFGFGTDTGPRGVLGWENRRMNARGHRMSADTRLSSVKRVLGVRYIIPLDNPVLERFVFALNLTDEDLGDTTSQRVNLSAARTTMIGRYQHSLIARVMHERDEIGAVTTSITQFVPESDWTLTSREPGIRPRSGYRANLNLQASDPALGAPVRFLRMRVRGQAIFPVTTEDRVLVRAELGTILTDGADQLSVSQRFFAGGDASVRGYGYNSLGPVDVDGRVIGGRHLATASVEYERWLKGNWGMALFIDSGSAFDDDFDTSTGAGIGVRWQSPVGVVAFDLAHPLDDPTGRSVRFHLSFGVSL